jgi:hypothetical protein
MTPMPPAWAMAMARRASVTVSMAEETIGRLSEMVRVSRVLHVDVGRHDHGHGRA